MDVADRINAHMAIRTHPPDHGAVAALCWSEQNMCRLVYESHNRTRQVTVRRVCVRAARVCARVCVCAYCVCVSVCVDWAAGLPCWYTISVCTRSTSARAAGLLFICVWPVHAQHKRAGSPDGGWPCHTLVCTLVCTANAFLCARAAQARGQPRAVAEPRGGRLEPEPRGVRAGQQRQVRGCTGCA